jgi:hypothetical protein
MPELRVDQFGQGCRVGFIADVPCLQPGQFEVSRAGAGFRHLGQVEIDSVGQIRRQQQRFVAGHITAFDVGEVTREARPFVHFHQQFRDFEVWPADQRLAASECPRPRAQNWSTA